MALIKVPLADPRTPETDCPDYSSFATVLIGRSGEQKQFFVHEQLLTTRSLFFRKAMSPLWIEAKKQTVKLPEDDPDIFRLYVDLLYAGRLAVVAASLCEDKNGKIEMGTLAKVHVLAEKLQDPDAKNKALAAILSAANEERSDGIVYCPGSTTIQIIYEGTPANAKVRKLIVDLYTAGATDAWIGEELPDEFIEELLADTGHRRRYRHHSVYGTRRYRCVGSLVS